MTGDEFWSERPVLGHIRDFARSRRMNPASTLGVVLVRANCMIPPHVVIPPIIGGRSSLNLFVALVGPSAGGKGGSEAAARDAIVFTNTEIDLPDLPVGSGEGIARTFQETGAESVHTALFTAPEVDTLGALFGRQASTIEAELRKVWFGEDLGFTNAQKNTRTRVPRLSYRAGLIVGVQPLRAGVLLRGADGGTPQRFLWLPVLDPEMPEQRPDPVNPRDVRVPNWPTPGDDDKHVELKVPHVAWEAIDQHRVALNRGEPGVDPLGGHMLLCRLKVAAGLMVLDDRDNRREGRCEVSVEDWELAAQIMSASDATRAAVLHAAEAQARQVNRNKARDMDERDVALADRKLRRVKEIALRRLDRLPAGKGLAHSELRKSIKSIDRDYFDTAITELIDEQKVTKIKLGTGTAYISVHVDAGVHPFSPAEMWGGPPVHVDADNVAEPGGTAPEPVPERETDPEGDRLTSTDGEPHTDAPPGGITPSTPGLTDRVLKIIARNGQPARAAAPYEG